MASRVFVTRHIPASGLDRIMASTECVVWPHRIPPSREDLIRHSTGCDGVLTLLSDTIDSHFFDAVGPQLKVVSNFAVGYNNIDFAEAARRGIAVGNTPDVLTDATADIAVTLLLAAARGFKQATANVAANEWRTWEPMSFIGQDLAGKTLGIVGMGRIGHATARRLHFGWGMKVIFASRNPKAAAEQELNATHVSFDQLLQESDFVSVHTDLNPETHHLFNHDAFQQMKSNAVFVNTSRGGVVDQAALHDALVDGQIFAAGLDVTDPEPLPADSRLQELTNCVIVPHIGSGTVSARNAMSDIAADNLLAGIHGQPLRHAVNDPA